MNMKILTTFFLLVLLSFASCNKNTIIYEGKASIISRSFDTSLQDSAMIYGYVRSAAYEDILPPYNIPTIFIRETNATTECDSLGYFSLKLLQGTYTVVCSEDCPDLKITIRSNEKVEIKFLIRVVIW